MTGTKIIERRAARVLVVDGSGRLLMLRGIDPARPEHRYWMTVGGGLEPGETITEAAARELFEETGLRMDPERFGQPVWRDVTEFTFNGLWYRQEQEFFLIRVASLEVDPSGWDETEQVAFVGHQWWTADDLATTTEPVYPAELPVLLRTLLGAA